MHEEFKSKAQNARVVFLTNKPTRSFSHIGSSRFPKNTIIALGCECTNNNWISPDLLLSGVNAQTTIEFHLIFPYKSVIGSHSWFHMIFPYKSAIGNHSSFHLIFPYKSVIGSHSWFHLVFPYKSVIGSHSCFCLIVPLKSVMGRPI